MRSAKDKRYEEMQNIIKTLRNHKKIKDMANLLTDFEDLNKAFQKAKKVVEREGNIPRFYIRTLAELEDFVNEVSSMDDSTVCFHPENHSFNFNHLSFSHKKSQNKVKIIVYIQRSWMREHIHYCENSLVEAFFHSSFGIAFWS